MATKKTIISVDDLEDNKKKTNKKSNSNLDLGKVTDFVAENRSTINKIVSLISSLFGSSKTTRTTKSTKTRSTSTRKTKSSKK